MLLTISDLSFGVGSGNVVTGGAINASGNVVSNSSVAVEPVTGNTILTPYQPASVTVNGVTYLPDTDLASTAGNAFSYNPTSGIVTLPTAQVGSAVITRTRLDHITDFGLRGLVVENFSLRLSMGDQPTCSFNLVVPLTIYDQTLAAYKPGKRIVIGNIPFAISDVSVVQGTVSETGRVSLVSVSCVGKWSQHLNPQPYNTSKNRNPSITSLQTIASYGGANLLLPLIPVVVPRTTSLSEPYDWANTLNDHALYNSAVVYWSDSNGITQKRIGWDVPIKLHLGEEDILGGVTINYPKPYLWQPERSDVVQMSDMSVSEIESGSIALPDTGDIVTCDYGDPVFTFTSTQITGEYAISEAQYLNYAFLTEFGQTSAYIPRNRVRLSQVNGNSDLPDWADGKVKDLSASSDITGFTKTVTKTTTIDDQPESEDVEIWGFAIPYTGLDEYASVYWQLVEKKTKTYIYGAYGYLLGYKVSGFKLLRFETPNTKKTTAQSTANDIRYQYSSVPIQGSGYYLLERIGKYFYEDTNYGVTLNDDGSLSEDPTWSPDFFVSAEKRSEFGIELAPKVDTKPQLTKGKEYIYTREISITNPGSLSGVSGFITKNAIQESLKKERYTEYFEEHSSEGSGFDSVSSNTGYQEFSGRPGRAPGLPNIYESQDRVAEQLELSQPASKFYRSFSVRNASYNGPPIGTVSYPHARTIANAKISAITDWYLRNVKEGVKINFSLAGAIALQEGDKISVSVNGKSYTGYILELSTEGKISQQVSNELFTTSITLGVEPPQNDSNKLEFTQLPMYTISYFLGDLNNYLGSPIISSRLK